MKSVLLSIRPKYCELIASGKKTVEVRKTKPKIEMPFKCYIYCTKNGRPLVYGSSCPGYVEESLVQTFGYSMEEADYVFGCWNGKVIGEFICNRIDKIVRGGTSNSNIQLCTLDSYWQYKPLSYEYLHKTQLDYSELEKYSDGRGLYGWNISDLQVYDEPKELSEFGLNRPPQGWRYLKKD